MVFIELFERVAQMIGSLLLVSALASISGGQFSYFGGWNLLMLAVFILWNCRQLWMLGSSGRASHHPGYEAVGAGGGGEVAAPNVLRGGYAMLR